MARGDETGMLWVKLSVDFYEDAKIVQAGVEAELLFVRGLAWAKKHSEDGIIPAAVAGRLAVGLRSPSEASISLCEVGLWQETTDGYQIAKWGIWNPTDSDRSKGGKLGQHNRWHQTRPNPDCAYCDNSSNNSDITPHITGVITEQSRAEPLSHTSPAGRLCDLLAELIHQNTGRKPKITQTWLADMDRMLRLDGVIETDAANIIRWAQSDTFWRANILSPSKLRQKYTQLQLKAQRPTNPGNDITIEAEWQLVQHEVRKLGSYGTPHFDHPRTIAAVRTLGWRNICQSQNLVELRKQFSVAWQQATNV